MDGAPWAAKAVPDRYSRDSLRGWWFYTRSAENREEINLQGQFVTDLGGGHYVVQLFSWMTGDETNCMPVHVMQVVEEDWLLFPDVEMRDQWYEKYSKREYSRERREERAAAFAKRMKEAQP